MIGVFLMIRRTMLMPAGLFILVVMTFVMTGVSVLAQPATMTTTMGAVAKPRYLTTALRASALLLRDEDVLASDERRLLQRVQLKAGPGGDRPQSSSPSPATYPRRLVGLADGTVLLADTYVIFRVRLDGVSEALLSGQEPQLLARDATHFYWTNSAPPYLRRAPLPPPMPARPTGMEPPPPVEAVASIPEEMSDLVVDAGEIFLADVPKKSVLQLRHGTAPQTFALLPSAPSALALTADALFVGTQDGSVYRIERQLAPRRIVRLGAAHGVVGALAVDGCFVIAATAKEIVAIEKTRGVRMPSLAEAQAGAVVARGGRIFYTDYKTQGLYEVAAPACPAATVPGEAREIVGPLRVEPPATAAAEKDNDPLAWRSTAKVHTIVVPLGSGENQLGRATARKGVERVLGEPPGELWARATDAQVAALRQQGFWAAYRDGVDLLRCVDVRNNPAAASRPPPAPFYDRGARDMFLVQLSLPTHAVSGLLDQLAQLGVHPRETPAPATLEVMASPASVARLRRQPYVTWVGPYGVRERLLPLAYSLADAQPGCGADPDAPLKALAAWMSRAPQTQVKLTAILFRRAPELEGLAKRLGGSILSDVSQGDETTIQLSVPRRALPELAAHVDVRLLEPYAEPSLGITR
jgi:hypothetical protein